MDLNKLTIGKNAPEEFNVIIEILKHGNPVKYEIDKDSGVLIIDRLVATSMTYPCDYGFIPNTLGEDGDPLDALVLCPMAVVPGCQIMVRPIGVLKMTDEGGGDEKILCVPVNKVTPYYKNINSYEDLPELLVNQIIHFFKTYKDLETGKWVKVEGFDGVEAAKAIVKKSILAK
ncbi:Inorganic pyrophosphatase [Candidatus Hepatincolaceae symbiont of Richtersius coronifer]